ncbi:hypothetical protein CEXT_730491 [Caerostris extrusa]|uniref:Uncharacterized protein n=1 Tax=Caerostris extrusa TaxID=172846 RepID=A0AAV4ND77_CAEEX|nr:hypothetical protein CEXT_730491 [Caerostris extrusa]
MSRKAATSIINSIYGERKEFSINLVLPPVFDTGKDVRITNTIPFFSKIPFNPLRIGTEIVVRNTLKEMENLSFYRLVYYSTQHGDGEVGCGLSEVKSMIQMSRSVFIPPFSRFLPTNPDSKNKVANIEEDKARGGCPKQAIERDILKEMENLSFHRLVY